MDSLESPQAAGLIGRTFGEFVVREPMNSGGFGMVFRAEQPALAREAVIKVLHSRLLESQTSVHRFLREARLASRLDHPYAAHTYAFGAEPDGVLWIAMELVRGTPLDQLLAARGPIPLARFVPLLDRICEVVHTAHEQGIVHRDLKPANVMVLARAGRLLPKLLDFGIAKLAVPAAEDPAPVGPSPAEPDPDQELALTVVGDVATLRDGPPPGRGGSADFARLTMAGVVMGSPHYMAPEQWMDSRTVDARTDLYALGVLSYEALVGHTPFTAQNRIELAQAHVHEPVPPLGPAFPRALDAVLARAMAKKADDRFASALELAAAFRAASGIESEPVPLPQLDDRLRAQLLAGAPQPLAEAVALLDATRHPHQARDAVWRVVKVAVRLIGATALACHSHVGAGAASTDPVLGESLRALRRPNLSDDQWLALAGELVRPFRALRDAHPVPELVSFLVGDASAPIRELIALHGGREHGGDSEEQVRDLLEVALPLLERALRGLTFLSDYPLAVPADDGAELWMGAQRAARPRIAVSGARLGARQPALLDAAGAPVVTLWPFVQVLEPAPGAGPHAFFFDGKGRRGARLVALPHSFEHEDDGLWDWFGELLGDSAATAATEEVCPFPGLAAFTRDDAERFTGRERETEVAVNWLRTQPLLAVVGPSGAGKSSLVQAGLVPALPDGWRAVIARPGPTPLVSLAARLETAGIAVGELRADLADDPGALGALLRSHALAERGTLVMVIDQLEEVFTLCADAGERELFARALAQAARVPDDPVRVVFTLRDDFLMRAEALPDFGARLGHAIQLVATPAAPDLHRILREPLARAGYELDDPALADEMVREVADRPGALALLSFTAAKLWDLRDQRFRQITRKAYASLGGIGGALARHAEESFAAMRPEEQRLARELFRRAVTAEGTRAALSRPEIDQILGAGGAAVVEKLVRARLLTASEAEAGGERIEIAHEALIEAWPRLFEWRRQDAAGTRLRDQLRAAARQWEERGRPAGLLWRGEALDEYRLWRSRTEERLTDSEQAFAAASLADAARARRLRRALFAGILAALVAVVIALLIFNARLARQRTRAEDAQSQSQKSQVEVEKSAGELSRLVRRQYESQGRQLILADDPLHGLAYLARAHQLGVRGPAHDFLIAEATRATEGKLFQLRHDGAIARALFSPDGALLVTCGYDGEARVWDAATGQLEFHLRHKGPVRRADIHGDVILTASNDGTAGLWDATSGVLLHSLGGHRGAVQAALFSPGGDRVVSVGDDDSVRLWDPGTGRLVRELLAGGESTGRLRGVPVGFSPDGSHLAVGGNGGMLRIWQVASGRQLVAIAAHRSRINDVRFAPDGTTLATASSDGTGAIWRLDGSRIAILSHRGIVSSIAFSADGSRLVTASADRTAGVWDTRSGKSLATLSGHAATVSHALFSPDGRQVATVSDDGTAQLWDAATGRRLARRLGHQAPINAVAFDPAGERMVTAGIEGLAIVWSTRPEERLRVLDSGGGRVTWAEFSPGGSRVATARGDGRLVVFDAVTGRKRLTIDAHQGTAYVARFSPDERSIASAGGDPVVRVWSAETGVLSAELVGHSRAVNYVAWSPDGTRLVSAGDDGSVRIWSASGAPLARLEASGQLFAAEFDRSGQRVVAVGSEIHLWDAATGRRLATHPAPDTPLTIDVRGDRALSCTSMTSARVWRLEDDALIADLVGHAGDVLSCRFSPDGHLAATGGSDGTTRIWDPDSGDLLAVSSTGAEVTAVGFSPDGAQLVVGGDRGAALWELPRFTGDFERLTRCRVPYVVQGNRVVRRTLDPDACAAR